MSQSRPMTTFTILLLSAGLSACGGKMPAQQEGAEGAMPPESNSQRLVSPGDLPGEFAVRTYLKSTYLTAVGGGGRITDVIHTDATQPSTWERFTLVVYPGTNPSLPGGNQYAFRTASGNYLTAVGGGGRTTDVFHTDATQVAAWEQFRFWSQGNGFHAIQTASTNYVTALGGGGHVDDPALHTDATRPSTWEWFQLQKCGDLGSGYQYAIWNPATGLYLLAVGGGGQTVNAIHPGGGYGENAARFQFVQQADGSYALQTLNGNYLTAVGGGGRTTDVFHTDATQVRAWEQFRLVDQGDCTYAIQTVSGHYVGASSVALTTDSSSVTAANKFRLVMYFEHLPGS